MAVIQVKRHLTGAALAAPATANAGEPLFSLPGFLPSSSPNALWIDNGTAVVPLVDAARQVELTGAQTITGVKTVSGAGAIALGGVANLTIGDGTTGQVLLKGAGVATGWGTPPPATVVTDGVTISGDGTTAGAIALIPAIFSRGLTWTALTSILDVNQASQTVFGGGTIATAPQIVTGTSDATFISPLGLRGQNGLDAAALVTTAKTIVPAINEIFNGVQQLTGVVIFAGSYDATTSLGTFNGQGGIPASPPDAALPVSAAANQGAYVICTVAGPGGVGNEPGGTIAVGDWLVSDGAGAWAKMPFGQSPITAANVGVAPATPPGATNVQDSLEAIYALTATAIQDLFFDATTFGGDALTALTQLTLTTVDGGTF